jgi:predicted metal-binding membrane protein
MGLKHGAYCLGCCWLLFAILFPLGVMNIAAMVGLTLLIFAEKSLPSGSTIAKVAGVALVAYGAIVLATAHGLPGMTT